MSAVDRSLTYAEVAEQYRLKAKAHRLHAAAYEAEAKACAIDALAGDDTLAMHHAIDDSLRELRRAEEADQNYQRCLIEADKERQS